MQVIYSPEHAKHHGAAELYRGRLVPCFEKPERAEKILAKIKEVNFGPVIAPFAFDIEPLRKVHSRDYLYFLSHAWSEWQAIGETGDALPYVWPTPWLRSDKEPVNIDGKLGFYSFDGGTPITAGTWDAARASANCALTGARLILGKTDSAFALCRPPGHHAGSSNTGGFCYLNNAAIAAQAIRDGGVERVAILDIDYHHGNGTQDIFYDRGDVFFASLHGDPAQEYPFFLGYADETGIGSGAGANLNIPLPFGTGAGTYLDALDWAISRITKFGADVVVVSLGVDTFQNDPISHFKLRTQDFLEIGKRIAALLKPTLFVMEGGYAVDEIGSNVVNVLLGFEAARNGFR